MFTKTDKALLDRTARHLQSKMKMLYTLHGAQSWGSSADSKKAKSEYDRIARDERDLRALGKRLLRGAEKSASLDSTGAHADAAADVMANHGVAESVNQL
jgi:hypothetical protein